MNALVSPAVATKEAPKPSTEKFYALSQLQVATLSYCKEWWQWRWGAPFDAALSGLDFRWSLDNWPKVAENERSAYGVLAKLREAIQDALSESAWAKSHPHVGFHAQALKEAEPHLREALKAMTEFAFASEVPMTQPTRREWITTIVEPRFGTTLEVEELARYSLLAGFWPATVPGERLPIESGVSVVRALSEEKKNIRAALQDLAERRRCDLAELEAYIARVAGDTES